jgi:aldehyde dehydrogenase
LCPQWLNCYHDYSAGAAFGGYKQSGVGRETYKTALEGYQQLKCVLQSTSSSALGFF